MKPLDIMVCKLVKLVFELNQNRAILYMPHVKSNKFNMALIKQACQEKKI